MLALDGAFVDLRRQRLDRNPGRREQVAADLAFRGQNQRFA
jgi:hypothetical protein